MATDSVATALQSSRRLIAPLWHTIVFVVIFAGLALVGGFFSHAARQNPQAVQAGPAVPRYISVIVFEWLLVLYVRFGAHKRGVRLRELIGGRWGGGRDGLRDIALAAALWIIWLGIQKLHLFGASPNTAEGLLPKGLLESLVWLPLALSAGFCEELAFRGYLQRQLDALTGSTALAVFFQAAVFGVGHLYEGPGAVARIVLFGLLYGLLAAWRKSLRPGMIAHAWSDIFGVIIFRGW